MRRLKLRAILATIGMGRVAMAAKANAKSEAYLKNVRLTAFPGLLNIATSTGATLVGAGWISILGFTVSAALLAFAGVAIAKLADTLATQHKSNPQLLDYAASLEWRLRIRVGFILQRPLRPVYNAAFLCATGIGWYDGYISKQDYLQRLATCREQGGKYVDQDDRFGRLLQHIPILFAVATTMLLAGLILITARPPVAAVLIPLALLIYGAAVTVLNLAKDRFEYLSG